MSYLTVRDVADYWGVDTKRVRAIARAGLVEGFQVSKRMLRFRPQGLPATAPDLPTKPPRQRQNPEVPTCGVYMLFSGGVLVYVGRSTELPRRITTHRRAGRAFDEVRAIPCDPDRANWLEAELIRTLQPVENIKRFERRAAKVAASLGALNA